MQRDIANMRDFEIKNGKDNFDIVYKKKVIGDIFKTDPDIQEILGKKSPRPLNKYADEYNPTPDELAEREAILKYNESISHNQIISYLKLDDLQKEVLNFIMYEIRDTGVSVGNNAIKYQYLIVLCLVHKDDMMTEYDILRPDLLSYIVKDLLNGSNVLGAQLKCESDVDEQIDKQYHARRLSFKIETQNMGIVAGKNKYDRFKI